MRIFNYFQKKLAIYCSLAVGYCFFSNTACFSQDSLANNYTDISKILFVKPISKNVSTCFVPKDLLLEKEYNQLSFKPGIVHKGIIPTNLVTQKVILKFNVHNSSDSMVSISFSPGFYYKHIQLYRQSGNSFQKLPSLLPDNPDSIGFRQFSLNARDSATIYAELGFIKTYINTIRPRLINASQTGTFISAFRNDHDNIRIVTYVFCGLLLMMILFSIANYLQGANREFLYYSGYAFFLGLMLFTKAVYDYRTSALSYYLESYLDFIMQCIGIMFYLIFMQKFLETKRNHPFLYKFYNIGILMLVAAMVSFTVLHYFSDNFTLQNMVENATKIFLLLMVVIFLVYSSRHWNDKLLRYLFWGNFLLLVFSIISQLSLMQLGPFKNLPGILGEALFYYEIALFLELVLFLSGLNYKNRRLIISQTKEREMLKAQNKLQEYEKELAVLKAQQQERERISADMHDELGAGMTAIRLMSEIARKKMKENTPVEINKISSSANEVLNKMNAIIWSMNSGNDTVDNLVSYIRSYAYEYFDTTPINCKVNTPENIPAIEMSGDKRRNIFLCVKESLTNVLKHSNAAELIITIETNNHLKITIADNGPGIDLEKIRQFGTGLKNINRRMETIGGSFTIENKNGTVTTLVLPF